jgi:hypothetical protein
LARKRRGVFANDLELLQQTFQERLAKQAPDDLADITDAVRADSVRAVSRSAAVDMVTSGVRVLYKEIRGTVAFLVVIPWSVFSATAGPVWPWLSLLLAAFLLLVRGKKPSTVNTMTASGLLLGAASVGWLFYWPADGLTTWEALGLACGAVGVALSVVAIAGRVNGWFARPDTSTVVLVLMCAGVYAALRHHQTLLDRAWWEAGLSLGLVLGLALASLMTLVQFGLAVFRMARKVANMRQHSEAEFTECTLFTAAVVADGGGRAGVVSATEYLAAVLERGIAGVLCREDPVSAEFIRTELAARARHLRAIKRKILFGRPGWRQDLLTWTDSALLAAARRDWLALPAAGSDEHTTARARPVVRVGRVVVRLFVFLLPVVILGAAWWSGMALDAILPAALPFVVAWMAVQVGELVRPGADMPKSESSADTSASLIQQNVSRLFTSSG